MYKNYANAMAKREGRNRAEVDLCQIADLVVAVGPKLKEVFSSYLRSSHQDVFQFVPGTFKEFSVVEHATTRANAKFKVLTFGRGDLEDFSLKGYDIAVQAIVELMDSSYHLIFVGAPDGKQDEVAKMLCQTGIPRNQLFVRSFLKDKQRLRKLFCEVDVAIMPSRTGGFGLTALEAMSAGLPILVSGNSGFGRTLRGLTEGKSVVIDSDDPKEWAKAIDAIRQKPRIQRLEEVQRLRRSYEERFSWERQCQSLVERMWKMVYDGVPDEIKARGPRAKLAYENALKKGEVKLYRARIMLMGKDRAGKTSLKKSFLGLPFDPQEDSTDGIQVDPSKFEVKVDQVKNWKLTNENLGVSQFMSDLAKMVAREIQED
ncbi:unnamed protein product [Porites lobata]|uniref:Glycosyl transferase family 1 domain-containing protein n=1 Tax=Porites lobata TaxID=104759 RepID=A0ABN8RZC7_9CNID|nr:unnamed protein product [Porites lobata]